MIETQSFSGKGYPPISAHGLNEAMRAYANSTVSQRMRFTHLHGGRVFGQSIPQKHISVVDPELYIGANVCSVALGNRSDRPTSALRGTSTVRPPFRYRRVGEAAAEYFLLKDVKAYWKLHEGAPINRSSLALCIFEEKSEPTSLFRPASSPIIS